MNFKFFNDDTYTYEALPPHVASWMWDDPMFVSIDPISQPYELITINCNGIAEFLNSFPSQYIVLIQKIKGVESGVEHTKDTPRQGWGFDIQNDRLEITYYHFTGGYGTEV